MTEQQPYETLKQFPDFELRRYPAHLVAEVEVTGPFADAGNRAFGMLVGFISGRNSASGNIAMTAPVVQQESTRIAMTSPVLQQPGSEPEGHIVGFVMPAAFSLATLPVPSDRRIRIREVPEHLAAVRAFSGGWTQRRYEEHLTDLRKAVGAAGLTVSGPPRFARFNPPWTPWFARRNEVVLPVADDASVVTAT